MQAEKHNPSLLQGVIGSGISGGLASIVTDSIYFPLDSLKTRIQASRAGVDYVNKAQGVSKLKGLIPTLTSSFPGAFSFFFAYESTKALTKKYDILNEGPYMHLLSAAAGETASALVRNPFEVMKQQMQIGLNSTMSETFKSIIKISGFRGLYAGVDSLILREIPFSAIQFPIYEFLKKRAYEENKGGNLTALQNATNGATAGAIAGFLTTPLDVAKTKLMTQRDGYYKNLLDCLVKVRKEEGFLNLFKAVHIRVFNVSFGGIVFFSSYEFIRKYVTQSTLF